MRVFVITIVLLIILIVYLIYLLYSKFKNDTINNVLVTQKLEEVDDLNNAKEIEHTDNIILTLQQNKKIFKIEIELYDDELPITCKNFRHIAFHGIKNKTYKNTNFYKIIGKNSIEGGDILNNDGTGGISLYGKYFIDESFKYKHSTPGVISMVNDGSNKNNSKFIITTKCCPELDGKQVVFGRVTSGMYHLFKLVKVDTNDDNEPIDKIEIIDVT